LTERRSLPTNRASGALLIQFRSDCQSIWIDLCYCMENPIDLSYSSEVSLDCLLATSRYPHNLAMGTIKCSYSDMGRGVGAYVHRGKQNTTKNQKYGSKTCWRRNGSFLTLTRSTLVNSLRTRPSTRLSMVAFDSDGYFAKMVVNELFVVH